MDILLRVQQLPQTCGASVVQDVLLRRRISAGHFSHSIHLVNDGVGDTEVHIRVSPDLRQVVVLNGAREVEHISHLRRQHCV